MAVPIRFESGKILDGHQNAMNISNSIFIYCEWNPNIKYHLKSLRSQKCKPIKSNDSSKKKKKKKITEKSNQKNDSSERIDWIGTLQSHVLTFTLKLFQPNKINLV